MIEAVALYFVSEDCNAWANFLKTKLGEKAYDICVHDIEASQASECKESYKANIILVSPGFLELPDYNHFSKCPEKQSLVVLLGVDDQEFEDTLKARGGEQILKIPLFETEANESSVRCLLVEIIDLYERNVATENVLPDPRLQQVVHQQDSDVSFESDNDPYDFPPSPKPIAPPKPPSANELQKFILNEKERKIYLIMDRKDEENILVQDENRPDTCVQSRFLGNALYEASLTDDFDKSQVLKIVTTKRRNVGNVRIGQTSLPTSRDKLSQIKQLLSEELEPLTVLCKALRLPEISSSCLDKFLAEKCLNFKMFDALKSLSFGESLGEKHSEDSSWPTLLHFGAEFGLSLFCDELLRVPGMDKFCHVTNTQDETPGQLARNRGFLQLAEKLDMLTVTQRDKRSSPANKDSGISDSIFSHASSDTSSYAQRTVDSFLDDTYEMPPPTPHQPKQYYINSNPTSSSKTDEVFYSPTQEQRTSGPSPPPKNKESSVHCPSSFRSSDYPERSSVDSSSSMYSTTATDSIISRTSTRTTSSSGSDTTQGEYVDMSSVSSSSTTMTSLQKGSRKTKCKPPAVHPKPTRSSNSSSGSREEQRNTLIPEDGTDTSEYMPMSEVTLHLKSSQSEPVVQNISIQEGGDDYMSPREVNAAGHKSPPKSLQLPECHNFDSTTDLDQRGFGRRPSQPEIAEHDDRKGTYPAPLPHNRSMSDSGTRVQGSPISPIMREPLFERGAHTGRDSIGHKSYSSDDDMSMNQRQHKGFFSKLKHKMGRGRKMSCPPEAIQESLEKFNKRNPQFLVTKPPEDNRKSNTSTSSSSSHSSFHEGQTPEESGAGEEHVNEPVRHRNPKKGLFGGKSKGNSNDYMTRRKSVRIDKMKKDKNLPLLDLPAKRK